MRSVAPVVVAALLAVSCTSQPPGEPGVVARLDTLQIHDVDLRSFAEKVPADGLGDERRQSYLRGLLTRHLLEREVRRRGLDTLTAVVAGAQVQARTRVITQYRRRALWDSLDVTEHDVAAYFDSLGLARQRQISGILTDTRGKADTVMALLQSGAPFEEVAKRHSVHRISAQHGGELGYVSRPQSRSLGIPDENFDSLADNEISDILPQDERFQIIRFTETRHARLEDHFVHIRNVLKTQALNRAEAQRVDQLAETFDWRVEDAGLDVLRKAGAGDGPVEGWRLSSADADVALFGYADKSVTVGEYVHSLPKRQAGDTSHDGLLLSATVDEIRRSALLYEAALRSGFGDTEADRRWRQGLELELAVTELRRQVLKDQPEITADDARAFYNDHPDVFRDAAQLVLVEALVANANEADEVLAAIGQGQSMRAVAEERTLRQESLWQAPGVFRMGHKERLQFPNLYKAALGADIGVVTGPVEVEGGFSVFKVIDRTPGAMPTFDRASRRAFGMAQKKAANQHFESFIDSLFDAHEAQLFVYPDELARALPDSTLQRLAAL